MAFEAKINISTNMRLYNVSSIHIKFWSEFKQKRYLRKRGCLNIKVTLCDFQ